MTLENPSGQDTVDNKAIYDARWPEWHDMKVFGPSSRWLRAMSGDLIARHVKTKSIRRVLDFGCGEGTTTFMLADRLQDAEVTGVDLSSTGIECARAWYRRDNLRFELDETGRSVEDGRYELVTCFEVLEHVPDWQALADRLCRVSSRYLLVSFPTGRMRPFEVNMGHLRNFRRGEFEAFVQARGFRVVQLNYAGFPFYSPVFRDACQLFNIGFRPVTTGRYGWLQRQVSDALYVSFRYFSTRRRFGDQFCGLFERAASEKGTERAR